MSNESSDIHFHLVFELLPPPPPSCCAASLANSWAFTQPLILFRIISLVSCLHSVCRAVVMFCADQCFPNLFCTPKTTKKCVRIFHKSHEYELQPSDKKRRVSGEGTHYFTWTLLPPAVFQRKLQEVICWIWGNFSTPKKIICTHSFYLNKQSHFWNNGKMLLMSHLKYTALSLSIDSGVEPNWLLCLQ